MPSLLSKELATLLYASHFKVSSNLLLAWFVAWLVVMFVLEAPKEFFTLFVVVFTVFLYATMFPLFAVLWGLRPGTIFLPIFDVLTVAVIDAIFWMLNFAWDLVPEVLVTFAILFVLLLVVWGFEGFLLVFVLDSLRNELRGFVPVKPTVFVVVFVLEIINEFLVKFKLIISLWNFGILVNLFAESNAAYFRLSAA
jgi:hypothetical protein